MREGQTASVFPHNKSHDGERMGASVLRVFNVEIHVGWHLFRLDGREVCGYDMCLGESIAHLNRPFSCARGNVQDSSGRASPQGSKEQVPAKGLDDDIAL